MREWLLLGVLALGGILGAWLLIFKSLAALYELWMSGREFDRLKRDAASRRMQRPSELMRKKHVPIDDADSAMPIVPQSILDSLSDEEADPRLVPQKGSAVAAVPQQPIDPADLLVSEEEIAPNPPQPPAPPTPGTSTTTTSPPPSFPLPPVADDAAQRPPRYDG